MKRQLLAGRFGPDDSFDAASAPMSKGPICSSLPARSPWIMHRRCADQLEEDRVIPSEIGIDLLVLAAHVHAADTRISRAEQSQDSWTREIRLVVPVSDPARWGTAAPMLKKSLTS